MVDFEGTDRFMVRRRLGHGGMGVVYRAFDRQKNTDVALKTLIHMDGDSIYRFKQEFRSLSEIFHPNIVQLHELFFDSDTWFFTMELLEGVHFLKHVRRAASLVDANTQNLPIADSQKVEDEPPAEKKKPVSKKKPFLDDIVDAATQLQITPPPITRPPAFALATPAPQSTVNLRVRRDDLFDEPKLRRLLVQLAEALTALHSFGVFHCDIKPSNVMVTNDERVVLLDFGLATRQNLLDVYKARLRETTSGTPAYMSPEQSAGKELTEASDWYSVGAMLYESLTGTLPIVGTPTEIILRKQHIDPVAPKSLVPDVPQDLSDLCLWLLQREPEERPTSGQILGALGSKVQRRRTVPNSLVSSFVGRKTELATIRNALSQVYDGGSSRIHLQSLSGFGKSALAQHFLNEVLEQGQAVVLVGRCYQRESMPHKAIDSLVDSLVRYLQSLPSEEAASLMPRDVQVLARMFPALLRISSVASAPRRDHNIQDLQELRQIGIGALKELFGRIADRTPLVLFIDDLQWGDADSAYALGELQAAPDPPAMLFLLAYRTNELEESSVLRSLVSTERLSSKIRVRTLDLKPLTEFECTELANALFKRSGGENKEAIDSMMREAQGNPFFLNEIAEYLESGASVEKVELGSILAARVSSLPEDAQELLRIVAVAGRPTPTDVAVGAAGISREADLVLNVLSAARLVQTRQTSSGQAVECYHNRVRSYVVGELEPEALRECHRRIARCFEDREGANAEALTFHWNGAGDIAKTAQYAALAASQAMEALAFDHAAELLRLVLEHGDLSASELRKVRIQLGDALQYAGSCVEAARTYLTAVDGAPPSEQLELRRRAAEQFMVSGHFEEGRELARLVLESVKIAWPGSTIRALFSLLYNRARLKIRGIRYKLSGESTLPESALEQIDAIWAMVMGLSMVDIVRGAAYTTRGLRSALDLGEPRRMCMLMTAQAGHLLLEGNRKDGMRLLEGSEKLAEGVNDSTANGNIAMVRAGTFVYQGKWGEARKESDKAIVYLREECLGVSWQLSNVYLISHIALFYLGNFRELSKLVPQREQEAKGRGNIYSACALEAQLGVVAWLAHDEVDVAREKVSSAKEQLTSDSFHVQHLWVLIGECLIDFYDGFGDRAWERCDAQWKKLQRSFVLQVEIFRFMVTVHLRAGCALSAETTPKRLKEAERAAKKIAKFPIAGAKSIAALTRASVAVKRGKMDAAKSLLEEAMQGFSEADMTLYLAATERRLGEILDDELLIKTADHRFQKENVSDPQRMTSMLAPGFRG